MGFCSSKQSASKPQPAAQQQSEKPSAQQPNAENTLLASQNSVKATSEQSLVHHRMMRVSIKENAVDALLEIMNGVEMQKALNGLQGLLDIEVTKMLEQDVIFTHSRWQDEASLQASEAKVAEFLKPMGEHFAGEPWRFYGKGGNVHLAGSSLWTFKPSASMEAEKKEEANTDAEPKPVEASVEPAKELAKEEESKEEPESKEALADMAIVDPQEAEGDKEEVVGLATLEELKVSTVTKETQAAPSSWFFASCCRAEQ
jgi:hypothetical protein